MLWFISLLFTLSPFQSTPSSTGLSEAHLTEGHYQLSVIIEDTTRGRGVPDIDVTLKLRRGFLFLGRKKMDLTLKTNPAGRVVIHGLPAGKVELLLHVEKDRPQQYHADLQPGPKKKVQLRSGRLSMLIEWALM